MIALFDVTRFVSDLTNDDVRVAEDVPLAPLTTYRLGGPARLYAEVRSAEDLVRIRAALDRAAAPADLPLLVLGRGSNVLISDHGFPGLVVRLGAALAWTRGVAAGEDVRAGSATTLPVLANWAARRGLSGLEFAVGVPGSVGGAVRMNAGAHGREVKDSLRSAEVFSFASGDVSHREAGALDLSYRHSNLTASEVVISATFGLAADDPAAIKQRTDAYRRHRAETQPGALQNAGSTFKNPPGDSAGRLVDAAGLKGFAVGGARVSELHANFFVAGDGATSQDVYDLIHVVRARVQERYGVLLEPEVRFIGSFDEGLEEVSG